jgi:hypothetical protein
MAHLAMIGALLGDLVPWILGAAASVLGILFYGRQKRKAGRKEVEAEQVVGDLKGAINAREKLDDADIDGDAIERLRAAGRLRD